ncbi:MAG: CPBP family intramembrane glutamic endopeptidase [Caldilineaceae bacterium]
MKLSTAIIKQHPVAAYFILAYTFTWILVPLLLINLALGVFGLLMPAVAAIVVAGMSEGKSGVKQLLRPLFIWRVHPFWYGVALGLPILLSVLAVGLGGLWGWPVQMQTAELTPLLITVFVLVVGEEIGWRGFALPRLLQRYAPLTASLLLGVLWAGWHLPMFIIPGTPMFELPFTAYLGWVVGLTFLFTWLYQQTQGSLLLATLLHGAVNSLGVMNAAIGQTEWRWLLAAVYCMAALAVVIATWGNFRDRKSSAVFLINDHPA